MQIEEALISDCFLVLKVSRTFYIPTIYISADPEHFTFQLFIILQLLDSPPLPEGSYKLESARLSARPSARLSVSFLRIGRLVFSET